MLPPIQIAQRNSLAVSESAGEAVSLPVPSGGNTQSPAVQTDRSTGNNNASVAAQINNLMLTSRATVRADMATIADMVGAAINITRQPGEGDDAFAARFVTALSHLSDSQRVALQAQLNQVLKGLQVQVLLQVLHNQDGPEAALLSAYMEIQRSNRDNLKAQTVVASYNQNAQSTAEDHAGQSAPSTAGGVKSPALAASALPQSSIVIALQASIAGAKDKEDAIARLAVALRQALSEVGTDLAAEDSVVTDARPTLAAESASAPKVAARSPATPAASTPGSAPANHAMISSPEGAPSLTPHPTIAAQNPTQGQTQGQPQPLSTVATPPASATKPVAMPTDVASAPLAHADTIGPPLSSGQQTIETQTEPAQPLKAASAPFADTDQGDRAVVNAAQPHTARLENGHPSKEVMVAAAIATHGLVEPTGFAPIPRPVAEAAPETRLLRQMFFQNADSGETAEIAALRALAHQEGENPEGAGKSLASASAKPTASADLPPQQAAEKPASHVQAVLTFAGAQAAVVPTPSPTVLPLAVALPIGSYLAMQDEPETTPDDTSVDAIDALSDEKPRRDDRRRDQGKREDGSSQAEDQAEEDGLYAMNDGLDNEAQEKSPALAPRETDARELPSLVALPAGHEGPLPADVLYWKIADLA